MTLQAIARRGEENQPWLIFLHGFSGDAGEWQPVGEALSSFSRLYLNLPGHGDSVDVAVTGFDEVAAQIQQTLDHYHIQRYWLIGYSLGGRVAMYIASHNKPAGLAGVIVEGGHPGLTDDASRAARWQSDSQWAARFRQQPLDEVFTDWYQQPVFASLTPSQRQALVALRRRNEGPALADMLLATSLAVQPDLRAALAARDYPFWYLCGERDSKFRAIAAELQAPCHVIDNAGHNAHRENPTHVVECLAKILLFRHQDTL